MSSDQYDPNESIWQERANGLLDRLFGSCAEDAVGSVHRAWGLSLIFVLLFFCLSVVESEYMSVSFIVAWLAIWLDLRFGCGCDCDCDNNSLISHFLHKITHHYISTVLLRCQHNNSAKFATRRWFESSFNYSIMDWNRPSAARRVGDLHSETLPDVLRRRLSAGSLADISQPKSNSVWYISQLFLW